MRRYIRIYRPQNLEAEIVESQKQLEELGHQTTAIRAAPPPDTFLGRAHYKILPLPYQEE